MNHIDPYLVKTWLKGWSLSRGLPLPVEHGSGFRVDVGWPEQKTRYVFPDFREEFIHLANTITEPWIFLKVCAAPELLKERLPARWEIQSPGYMMTCFTPMKSKPSALTNEYVLKVEEEQHVSIVKLLTHTGDVAAIGRLVIVDDFVIYDRIETAFPHRRKGLATIILKTLESIALSKVKTKGILVATEAGKGLYETLGWQLYSPYTTVVIPETDSY